MIDFFMINVVAILPRHIIIIINTIVTIFYIIFTNKIAELSEKEGHHPFIHIDYKKVTIILFTHKINGLHENDFILASKCDIVLKSIK